DRARGGRRRAAAPLPAGVAAPGGLPRDAALGLVAPPELPRRDRLLVGPLALRRGGGARALVDRRRAARDRADVPLREPADDRDADARAPSGLRRVGGALLARPPAAAAERVECGRGQRRRPPRRLPARAAPRRTPAALGTRRLREARVPDLRARRARAARARHAHGARGLRPGRPGLPRGRRGDRRPRAPRVVAPPDRGGSDTDPCR